MADRRAGGLRNWGCSRRRERFPPCSPGLGNVSGLVLVVMVKSRRDCFQRDGTPKDPNRLITYTAGVVRARRPGPPKRVDLAQ